MRHEPGDSPRGTRAASTGSSWVSLRREEMEGGQEGRERGREGKRKAGRKEGTGILLRVGTEGNF